MNKLSAVFKKWPKLKGIKCPNPANSGIHSLDELKKRFNIEGGCVSCLRCMCGLLMELPEKDRNPDCLSFMQDNKREACVECNVNKLCSEAIAYAM